MRILILNTDYMRFLRTLYLANANLADRPYKDQLSVRNDSLFGVADYYSKNLRELGHVAEEIHVNNPWLQYAWARQHGLAVTAPVPPGTPAQEIRLKGNLAVLKYVKGLLRPLASRLGIIGLPKWEAAILRAQIEAFKPDLILNHDPSYIGSNFLQPIRKRGCIVVGQIAAPLPPSETYAAYDFMISSLPNFVAWFRAQGIPAELSRLAFEPSILERLGPAPLRDIEVSFVGSLSLEHASRIELLEYVARRAPLRIWGNGIERLPRSSPLHGCFQAEAWGRDMYIVLRRSRITLNKHIDLSAGMANNMRLYEAAGMGALLLTDEKQNLHEIFDPGEVATYASPSKCVDRIDYYLRNENERAGVASAGQKRAIEHHSYALRMKEFMDIVGKYQAGGARALR